MAILNAIQILTENNKKKISAGMQSKYLASIISTQETDCWNDSERHMDLT